MPPQKQKPQDITPGTLSGLRPGQSVVPVTSEDDARLNDYSRQQGINKTEAMRRAVENMPMPNIPQQQPKMSMVDERLNRLQTARQMGIVDVDPEDPVNLRMKQQVFKDLGKDTDDRMTTREIMEMNMVNFQMILLQKSMGSDNNTSTTPQIQQMLQKYDSTISDLKAENEKSRQFYEQKLKEQEDKFKEIVLEKRMKDIEEGQVRTLQTLSQQIAEIDNQLKAYQNIPLAPTADQKKDAIDHLEQMGGTLDRIKKALTPFGIIPQSGQSMTASPGSAITQYKNPDGSMNMTLYGIDKATEVAGRLLDAWSKKAPEPKQVQETQIAGGGNGATPQQKQMSYQEIYTYLLNKGSLTPDEQEWKVGYEDYITKTQQKRSGYKQQAQPPPQPQPQTQPQTNEAIYTDAGGQEQEQVSTPHPQSQPQPQPQPEPEEQAQTSKKGIVERLQQMEAERSKYTI